MKPVIHDITLPAHGQSQMQTNQAPDIPVARFEIMRATTFGSWNPCRSRLAGLAMLWAYCCGVPTGANRGLGERVGIQRRQHAARLVSTVSDLLGILTRHGADLRARRKPNPEMLLNG